MDSSNIRRNQVLLIIITVFFQFHLPYFSLSSANAAQINEEGTVNGADSSKNEGQKPSLLIVERKIPYLSQKSGERGDKNDTQPKLLGIHVPVVGGDGGKGSVVSSSKGERFIVVTAYSSTNDQTDSSPCTTANGFDVCENAIENVVAANFLPFGTHVQFPDYFGDREFVVQDRMHPRFSNRIDIWMKSREAAKQFGVKRLKMVVVPENIVAKSPEKGQVAVSF